MQNLGMGAVPTTRPMWARLRLDVNCGLRRGAWYRVDSLSPFETIVSVSGEPRPLSRRLLEIRSARPRHWTIVRQRTAFPRPAEWPAAPYAVCPGCGSRVTLPPRRVTKLTCSRCLGSFRVAWDEAYLQASPGSM
jgi:hypothetical protein